MNEHPVVVNHVYLLCDERKAEIGFILRSNKNFVEIEIENSNQTARFVVRLIDFLTIAETMKSAAGIGVLK